MSQQDPNRNFILIFAVIAIGFLIYGIINFNKAFHQVGINFQVTRSDALEIATEFLESRNFDIDGFKKTVIFNYNGGDKLYLEKELSVERMTALAKDSLDIWYWYIRFFKPLQKLEYRLHVNPKGEITRLSRLLEEDAAAPKLEKDAAKILAEQFIINKMKVDLDLWEFVEGSSEDRPNRRDHTFTYELKGFKAGEAEYRMKVSVQGAEVSFFRRYLDTPEEWWREWSKQRSQNNLFQNIAQFFAFLMFVGVFIYFFKHVRKKQIPWKITLGFGIALAAVNFIMGLNSFPLAQAYYDTTESYSSFVGMQIFSSLTSGIGLGMMLVLLFGAGEFLYRQDYPSRQYFPTFFTRSGSRTRNFFHATIMGYLLAGFHIGFVVMFYIMGEKLGAWSPTQVKYTNAVSTPFPWIYPLAISMAASMGEEFWFRLFGISLFKRLTRSTWLAIIIPAFIWGFLHSSYPQQPGFVRGIEVGLIGILAGVIMIRFGLWATLTWHFVIDAVLIGLFLFQSDNAYFWTSGLIVCGGLAIPGIIALVHYLRHRGFVSDEEMLNKTIEPPSPCKPEKIPDGSVQEGTADSTEPEVEELVYTPLSAKIKRIALIVGVVGILIALLPGPRKFGEDFSFDIPRDQAIQMAKDAVRDKYGVDPDTFMVSTILPSDEVSEYKERKAYLRKYSDLEEAEENLFSSEGAPIAIWFVNFERELSDDWYTTSILIDGSIYPQHVVPDSLTGAQLELDSAKAMAIAAFEKKEPNHEQYHLIIEKSYQQDNRRDFNFRWETIDPVVEKAHYRRSVSIKGDDLQVHSRWLHIPEEFKRQEDEKTFLNVIGMIILFGSILGGGIIAVVMFGKRIIKHTVRWRSGLIAGGIVLVLGIIKIFNDWVNVWEEYRTSVPVANHISDLLITGVIEILTMAGLTIVVISLVETLVREYYGGACWKGLGKGNRTATYDGLIAILGIAGASLGLGWLLKSMTGWFNLPVHSFEFMIPMGLNTHLPWLAQVIENSVAIVGGALMLLAYMIIKHGLRRAIVRRISLLIACMLISFSISSVKGNLTTGEILWQSAQIFTHLAMLYAVIKYFIVGRLWVLILGTFIVDLISNAAQFIGWEGSQYQIQGWILTVIAIITVLIILRQGFARKTVTEQT